MILYLDTSSLVKLYVAEGSSAEVRTLAEKAELLATSVLAYPEARSAFARLQREGLLTESAGASLRAELDLDWPHLLAIDLSEAIWRQAGDLAERHALRALDSLHLASFLALTVADLGVPARFSTFDERLDAAARRELFSADDPP